MALHLVLGPCVPCSEAVMRVLHQLPIQVPEFITTDNFTQVFLPPGACYLTFLWACVQPVGLCAPRLFPIFAIAIDDAAFGTLTSALWTLFRGQELGLGWTQGFSSQPVQSPAYQLANTCH